MSGGAAARWGVPALIVVATAATAALGAAASIDAQAYYASLRQPAWAPPAWLFGPVWTTLYLMMAAAAVLVVRRLGLPAARPALALYAVQLVLNALWTWLFFRWHQGALAAAEVLMLLLAIVLTARAFWRARPLAGWLLVPYLVWVTFASALTVAVWRLNPTML
jgi:tryptophan-rich sensory protein